MATLHTHINPRSAEFATNSAAMLEQVNGLRSLIAQVHQGGGPKARSGTPRGANCCRAIGSTACSTLARRSSKSASWPPMRCTAKTSRPLV